MLLCEKVKKKKGKRKHEANSVKKLWSLLRYEIKINIV